MSISCREATGRPIAVQFRRRGLNASASARKKKAEGLDGELVLVCASAGNANKALNTAPETPASRTRLRQAKACCTGGRRPRRLFVFAAHGPPGVARTLHVCAGCTRQTARGALSASTGLPLLSSRAKRAPLSQLHVGHGKQANPETRSVVRPVACSNLRPRRFHRPLASPLAPHAAQEKLSASTVKCPQAPHGSLR